ncbi:NAD(P)H-hydrate dehydratase [Apilactobacillus micheneri]|uniref:ADP-dependent (S)-NAD(P)H-hydrate dehydratase n=1 Tax=Apilactobacillus micheneri TaxID=1899430 RepID=A0A9Q8ILD4_9LACO|nr:NAD(P)H-hydrate dehydratase [Apilactobacillus micheneri]TPR38756.1 NAD(P)H-hydrate dehydratase [Apilactobacillus micheneri]TPR41638.1 NAD(P)H-hydrate dehydratase [Apilactobacillus micheneri]TPR42795.1 NAD(P)H-hydrate dehydratase [Apilactobacillus micheneri]TPR42859.1 NAD(P)H-hydrate dehydratase [Apilactobacillus micheneri]TPR43635.1 NAD(P)H-hydrate dehydratase [Apilactobacillus micheneri]
MDQITKDIVNNTIRIRPNNSYKGTYGKVGLIGGNQNFGGAIIMASSAAVHSGAGLVTTFTDKINLSSLHDHLPEAMFADYNDEETLKSLIPTFNVIVIGPGLGTDTKSLKILNKVFNLIQKNQIVVIDGSAITMIAKHKIKLPKAIKIFTPHQMEWQRLSNIKIKDQNEKQNMIKAKELNSIVVLKSHHTEVYNSDSVFQNPGGTPAQATGGMGDTLAGMIGGFVAQFNNKYNAVLSAVFMHSKIADELAKDQYVVLPSQIIKQIPNFMKRYEKKV